VILSILPLFSHHLRPLTSASHFSITRPLRSFRMIIPCTLFFYHFSFPSSNPFSLRFSWRVDLTESLEERRNNAHLLGNFSECTNYNGLPLLFFSKFFTFSSLVTIRGQCVTPQEMLKVRYLLRFALLLLLQSCISQLEAGTSQYKVLLTSAV